MHNRYEQDHRNNVHMLLLDRNIFVYKLSITLLITSAPRMRFIHHNIIINAVLYAMFEYIMHTKTSLCHFFGITEMVYTHLNLKNWFHRYPYLF